MSKPRDHRDHRSDRGDITSRESRDSRDINAHYIYKSYMGYRPGGVTGRVAGAKWQEQNEFHVEEPTKAII